jgi:4-diphosphocytidyl-2-C-methyl-D-erythritol kinase
VTASLSLFCPAKLNLHLRIVGRRSDGYHLLETLFHAIDLGDDLSCARSSGALSLAITADDPRDALPVQDDNLVLRAARAFANAARVDPSFSFTLHKRVPHGGGLGGGSSDAAAALRLCNAICGEPLDRNAMLELARPLGADVAFFLDGGTQWGTGVGDTLQPVLNPPSLWFTLLVPPFGCPTADVYKTRALMWKGSDAADSMPRVRDHLHDVAPATLRGEIVNDLAAAAELVRPQLALLRERAEGLSVGNVAMTGSGSTLFVVADSERLAAEHRERLRPLCADGVRILGARSLGAAPQVRTATAATSRGGIA